MGSKTARGVARCQIPSQSGKKKTSYYGHKYIRNEKRRKKKLENGKWLIKKSTIGNFSADIQKTRKEKNIQYWTGALGAQARERQPANGSRTARKNASWLWERRECPKENLFIKKQKQS